MWYAVFRPDPMAPGKYLRSKAVQTWKEAEDERKRVLAAHPQLAPSDVYIAGAFRGFK